MKTLNLIIIAFFLVAGSASAEICNAPVTTSEGPVQGQSGLEGRAGTYKGIPYAEPPIGELRWQAPVPAAKRSKTLEAFAFGPSCVQNESFTGGGKSESFSEDCLFLNVYRPAAAGTYPVMFWIHGGGYSQGSGSYEMYDGSRLAAERKVVVVTINYRLGPFGFLALPELSAENPDQSAGNYGVLDMILALKWTRDNIAAFGGDPQNVTIFGESAGGVAVCTLLASKPAAGLFHRAIMESGACDLDESLEDGFKHGESWARAAGCEGDDRRACLRAQPAEDLIALKKTGFRSSGHVDGYVLEKSPIDLLKAGEFNRVPFMAGSNKDEFNVTMLLLPGAPLVSKKSATKLLREALGPRADDILAMYDFDDYRFPMLLVGAVIADGFGSRAYAAAEAAVAHTSVYFYRFDWDDERLGKTAGAFHGLEIPFVFGNLRPYPINLLVSKAAAKKARPLSEAMMSFWTNFGRTGDPNGQGLAKWPVYSVDQKQRMHLDTPPGARTITGDDLKRLTYFAALSMSELGFHRATGDE